MTKPTTVTDTPLLDLAEQRFAQLVADTSDTDSTLDAVMRRLFDPRERDLVAVSAFQSAL